MVMLILLQLHYQEQADKSEYPTLTKSSLEDIIKEKFADSNLTISSDKTEFGTGDIVTVNDKKSTIVLLGDINSNGKVDVIDASMAFNSYKNNTTAQLSVLKQTAGDYINNGRIDPADAAAIFNTAKGKFDKYSQVKLPDNTVIVLDADVTEAVELLDTELYTPTIKEEDNKTVISLAVNAKDKNGDDLYVIDAFNDIVDTFLGDNAESLRDDAIEAYTNDSIEEITIKFGDKEKKYSDIIKDKSLKQKLDNAIKNYNSTELKNLIKQEIGNDRITSWQTMPITNLIEKSQIEIDVKLKETSDLSFNSETEKTYIIDFVKGLVQE